MSRCRRCRSDRTWGLLHPRCGRGWMLIRFGAGYGRDKYLRAKTTSTHDMTITTLPCCRSAAEDETMAKDFPRQTHGRVRQGTKESSSRSRSSSSEGPTRYTQTADSPPNRPGVRVMQLWSYALQSVLQRCSRAGTWKLSKCTFICISI